MVLWNRLAVASVVVYSDSSRRDTSSTAPWYRTNAPRPSAIDPGIATARYSAVPAIIQWIALADSRHPPSHSPAARLPTAAVATDFAASAVVASPIRLSASMVIADEMTASSAMPCSVASIDFSAASATADEPTAAPAMPFSD